MKIGYVGPIMDHSGYGETSRHHVAAFHAAGVEIAVRPVMYTLDSSDFGEIGKLVESLISKDKDYKIKLLHVTPDQFPKYIERGKYHVGFCYWETDKVPLQFADGLRLMNEIWTASEANKQAIENAGVKVPVYIIPQPIEADRKWPKPYKITDFDGYLFYSIFEWTERKNPAMLLEAYWREFQNDEKVGLLIKTYHKNFGYQNKKLITDQIVALKARLGLPNYPPLFLYKELMERDQVMRIHSTGDCFVSAHRGEGWGIPQVEAMLAGKPVISTGYGGVHEYLNKNNAYIVPYKMIPVEGMESFARWYDRDQSWAEPDIDFLRKALRHAYENPSSAKLIGSEGSKFARENFNLKHVGKLMSDRLKDIQEGVK